MEKDLTKFMSFELTMRVNKSTKENEKYITFLNQNTRNFKIKKLLLKSIQLK